MLFGLSLFAAVIAALAGRRHIGNSGKNGVLAALGDIIFDTEERCRDAINEYASELIWYFTEKKNRL